MTDAELSHHIEMQLRRAVDFMRAFGATPAEVEQQLDDESEPRA